MFVRDGVILCDFTKSSSYFLSPFERGCIIDCIAIQISCKQISLLFPSFFILLSSNELWPTACVVNWCSIVSVHSLQWPLMNMSSTLWMATQKRTYLMYQSVSQLDIIIQCSTWKLQVSSSLIVALTSDLNMQ